MGVPTLLVLLALTLTTFAQRTIDILAWPLDADVPVPYARVSYTPNSPNGTIETLHAFTAPTSSLVRLGFRPSSSPKEWTGIALPASNFESTRQKTLRLWTTDSDEVYALSFRGDVPPVPKQKSKKEKKAAKEKAEKIKKAKAKGKWVEEEPVEVKRDEVVVEVVKQGRGKGPVLNRPVVVNADGRVDEAEPEKSFLQKYWWAIGLFLVLQVVMGGGGGDK